MNNHIKNIENIENKKKIDKIIKKHSVLNYILLDSCLENTSCVFKRINKGKVRDIYEDTKNNQLTIITSDRLSSFNRVLTTIPSKGVILNKISTWWFNKTKHIVPNHLIDTYHRTMVVKKTQVFPIEFIMRGYLTGTTNTSIWYNYKNGMRYYCGHILEEGLKKNQKLSNNLLTPTTKGENDLLIGKQEIIEKNIMTQEQFDICSNYAHNLFTFGQNIASYKGLLLVDTKYEFGIDDNNNILLIDELHTPDSSRYWLKHSYSELFENNNEPEIIDKDYIRRYVNENYNDPYNDNIIIDDKIRLETSNKYNQLYEIITSL